MNIPNGLLTAAVSKMTAREWSLLADCAKWQRCKDDLPLLAELKRWFCTTGLPSFVSGQEIHLPTTTSRKWLAFEVLAWHETLRPFSSVGRKGSKRTGRPASAPKPVATPVQIRIQGGLVQAVGLGYPEIPVVVRDYDIQGSDAEDLVLDNDGHPCIEYCLSTHDPRTTR